MNSATAMMPRIHPLDPRNRDRERPRSPSGSARKRPRSQSPSRAPLKALKAHHDEAGLFVTQHDMTGGRLEPLGDGRSSAANSQTSIGTVTKTLSEHVSRGAALQFRKDQAAARLERAKADYEATYKSFNQFPIIAEQKTSARDKAQKDFDKQEASLKFHLSEQPRLAAKFEQAIGQILDERGSRTDQHYVSRNELDGIRASVRRLEEEKTLADKRLANEVEQGRLSRERFDKELESIKLTMRIREQEFDTHKTILSKTQKVVREQAEKAAKSTPNDHLVTKIRELSTKLDEKESEWEKLASFIGEDFDARSWDETSPMAQRLRARAGAPSNAAGPGAVPPELMERIVKMEEELELLCDPEDQARRDEAIEQIVDDKLRSFATIEESARHYDDLFARIDSIMRDILPKDRRDGANNVENRIGQVTTALQAQLNHLTERTKTDEHTFVSLQSQFAMLNAEMKKLRTASPRMPGNEFNGRSPNLANGNAVQRPAPADNAELDHIKEKIGVLQLATNHLQHMYDNLTTDDVVRAMVDQISRQYPNAKDAHETATRLHALRLEHDKLKQERSQIEQQIVNDIHQVRQEGSTNAANIRQLEHKVDTASTQYKEEIARLDADVNEHDTRLKTGTATLTNLEAQLTRCEEMIAERKAEFEALAEKVGKT